MIDLNLSKFNLDCSPMRSRVHGSQVSLDLSLVLDADGSTPKE
jgi:hypothetical protein